MSFSRGHDSSLRDSAPRDALGPLLLYRRVDAVAATLVNEFNVLYLLLPKYARRKYGGKV